MLGKVLNFLSLGCFLNCILLFCTQNGESCSNRQFLNLLAVPEIKFQSIICSRHNFLFQLCVLLHSFLQLLRASEIADQVTPFSCSIKLLVLSIRSSCIPLRPISPLPYLTNQVVSRLSECSVG